MSVSRTDKIKCMISGGDISPESFSAKELSEFITGLEKSLFLTAHKEDPTISQEDFVLGLVEINKGSVDLSFTSNYQEESHQAIMAIAHSIKGQEFNDIPRDAIEPITEMIKVLNRRQCKAHFYINGTDEPYLTLDSTTKLPNPKDYQITGETTIYGEVVRVGGLEPKAMVKLSQEETLSCKISVPIAKELASRLYCQIALKGIATWDIDTYIIKAFQVTEVLPYEETSITNGIKELAEVLGDHYKDIQNVEKYVARLRSEEW